MRHFLSFFNASRLWFVVFLLIGLIVQCFVFLWRPNNIWDLISGCFGIVAVVLCAKGNILTYVFGFAQILTYTYLCSLERFYAGIATNVFYFFCQLYGSYNWYRKIKGHISLSVPSHTLNTTMTVLLTAAIICFSLVTGWFLQTYTDDSQPFMDAFTTVPALVAEVLMILAIREHWFVWFFVDILYVILWMRADNYCMVMQYVFWCANCVYGYIQWTKTSTRPMRLDDQKYITTNE